MGSVDRASNKRVAITSKFADPPLGIREAHVPVIAHNNDAVNLDARILGYYGNYVANDVIDHFGWTQSEVAPLDSLGNHQAGILIYRSSKRHASCNGRIRASSIYLKLLAVLSGEPDTVRIPSTHVRRAGHASGV